MGKSIEVKEGYQAGHEGRKEGKENKRGKDSNKGNEQHGMQ